MKKYAIALVFASVATFSAWAFAWKAKTVEQEKAALVGYLTRNADKACSGVMKPKDFASQLVAQTNALAWMSAAMEYGQQVLAKTEGRDATDPIRRFGLEVIDYPLHVDNYNAKVTTDVLSAFNRAVIDYARGARDRVLREIRAAKVPRGQLKIWRVYNMAFVLKGPEHTVAIDFTTRPDLIAKPFAELIKDFQKSGGKSQLDFNASAPKAWSDREWCELASLVDLAIVTHPHGDHVSEPFLREIMRLGKPLVLPGDVGKFVFDPEKKRGEMVPYTTGKSCVKLTEDHSEPVDVRGVMIRNFRGFQDKVPCNVYMIEIDGVRVVDNGDNYDRGKEKLLSKCPPADVIIASTWNSVHHILGCVQAAPGFDSKHAIFIPAHENELGHSVDHRESYAEMYSTPERLGKPAFPLKKTFPLGWGESIVFKK